MRDRRRLFHAKSIVVLVLLGATGMGELRAQSPLIMSGSRVRVWHDSTADVGLLQRVDPDRVFLARRRDTLAIRVSQITTIELSKGRDRHILAGTGLGLIAGFAIGFIAIAATYGGPQSDNVCSGPLCGVSTLALGATVGGLFALPGAAVGAIVGSQVRTDRWVIGRLTP